MEQLLENIIKDTAGQSKHQAVTAKARTGLEFLESYSRAPASQYRRAVLPLVTAALESNNARLAGQCLSVIHKLGTDNRFYSLQEEEEEEESSWLTQQVISSLSPLPGLSSDLQTDYLQAVLTLTCHSCWLVTGQISLQVMSLCQDILTNTSSPATRTAAHNVAANTLASLGRWLCRTETERAVEDIIPVLQYLCSRSEETFLSTTPTTPVSGSSKKSKAERELLLSCLDTTVRSLNKKVTTSTNFCTFIWRSLCPAVIKILVRGQGHALVCSLTTLIGHLESHRPVLEATFHKMLVQTPPDKRLEAIKAVSKLVGETNGLLDLTWLEAAVEDRPGANDMALIIMLMESLDQCATSQPGTVKLEVVEVIRKICESLENWCEGRDFPQHLVSQINRLYPSLENTDFLGPHSYTNEENIPEEFRFTIQENMETFSENFDTSSVATNDSINQIEVSYDSSEDSSDSEGGQCELAESLDQTETDDTKLWLNKVPRTLHSPHRDVTESDQRQLEAEETNATTFHKLLKNRIFRLNSIRSPVEIDHKIQEFSSQFCQDFSSQSPKVKDKSEGRIMNADGIYFTAYRVIHLNVKLRREGHYDQREVDRLPTITEAEFLRSVLDSGILIYLSSTWLREVYRIVLSKDLFEGTQVASPIVHLCSDIDGFGRIEEHGQLLVEYRRLERRSSSKQGLDEEEGDHILAGRKYSRRILSAIWDHVISISSKVMSSSVSQELSANLGVLLTSKKTKSHKASLKEAQWRNIKVLQSLLRISKKVGFQNLTGSVFCLLTNIACHGPASQTSQKPAKNLKFSSESLLALESIIANGLELASHSQDCWKHIFKCCQYVRSVEDLIFSPRLETAASPRVEAKVRRGLEQSFEGRGQSEEGWLGFVATPETQEYKALSDILTEAGLEADKTETVQGRTASKCVCFLMQQIDKLFSSAASHLNLMSLTGYLRELCFQSHKELIALNNKSVVSGVSRQETFLVTQLSEAVLRCIRSGRPMLHLMLAWAIAGPHLMEASSHSEPGLSKISVQAIHNIITSLLHFNSEMSYFHFNESLFKPYESLIQLELCDSDVQDQIIASIQQFVDGSASEIRSGWRPLFGALRSIKFSELEAAESSHIAAILDVFEAFLSTDSPIVFAHAALDCIMCLLKHIKNTKEVKASKEQVEEVVDISEIVVQQGTPELSEAALGYIVRCHSVLAKMFLMSSSPIFRGAENIHTGSHPIHVSSVVPGKEVISFDPTTVTLIEVNHTLDPLTVSPASTGPSLLENSGLLKIWFLLIDGIVSALSSCQVENQSATLDTFFTILESLTSPPYSEFGLYCVNHLLLPGIQTWLRTASTRYRGWSTAAQGIKQTLGMTTEVVVDWVLRPEVRDSKTGGVAAELMLKQLVIILVECCLVNSETIARLGCSCLRHLVRLGSTNFSSSQWDLVVSGLVRATEMSLYPAHQLMASFMSGSENFTGDIGSVRVAARRDCTVVETNRIRQLCYQILLMDSQLEEDIPRLTANPDQEDRSYLFLLQPLDTGNKERREDTVTVRVTLGELVTGLTAHQILLQTIGGMLLEQTSHLTPPLSALLPSSQRTEAVLASLSPAQLSALMAALRQSHHTALSLDNRPGLKFLLQKVAQIPQAANLYKQTGAAWSIYMITLFHLCLSAIRDQELNTANIQEIIEEHSRLKQANSQGDIKDEKLNIFCDFHDSFTEICESFVDNIGKEGGEKQSNHKQMKFFSIESENLEDLLSKIGLNDTNEENVADNIKFSERQSPIDLEVENDEEVDDENQKIQEAEEIIALQAKKLEARRREIEIQTIVSEIIEDILLNISDNSASRDRDSHDDEEQKSPFGFSDFASQPNRPFSPNLSDNSDCEEKSAKLPDDQVQTSQDKAEKPPDMEESPTKTKQIINYSIIMDEYKSRKPLHTMPQKSTRKNPFIKRQQTSHSRHPVDPEIEQQRSASLLKDSQAKNSLYTELVGLILRLIADLNDEEFKIMLPLVFTGVKTLTVHAGDFDLKNNIAEFYSRVASVFGFAATT